MSTRAKLKSLSNNLDESMGVRQSVERPQLSPVPKTKDLSRRPLRNVGTIAIDQVFPDPNQPRTIFSDEAIERLGNSIRDRGQLSPIRVRWSDDHDKWIIISGERRWRATKLAGLDTIACTFVDGEPPKSAILEEQLIENCLREDLGPIEQALAFRTLMDANAWTGKELAQTLRLPASQVSRAFALLKLPEKIQERVTAGDIAPRAAYELTKIKDERERERLAEQAATGQLTHADAVTTVKKQRQPSKRKPRGLHQTFMAENGIKVVVTSRTRTNYHEVREALQQAIDEVDHRINNNVQLN